MVRNFYFESAVPRGCDALHPVQVCTAHIVHVPSSLLFFFTPQMLFVSRRLPSNITFGDPVATQQICD